MEIFDIYLLEALVNGILLGGVLALLALGFGLQLLAAGIADLTRRNPAFLAGALAEGPR